MPRFIHIIGFAILLLSCNDSDNKKDKIFSLTKDELLKEIAEENIVAGSVAGPGGNVPDQWLRYVALKAMTNEQELIDLTDHTNATVKCYAFTALIEKESKAIFDLVLKKVTDTGRVRTLYGCLLSNLSVCEFYVQRAVQTGNITVKQKQIADSTVFSHGNFNLISALNILESLAPSKANYDTIKKRVAQHPEYIVALAKYRNPSDKKFISDLLKDPDRSIQYWGFRAIANYPDKSFFQALTVLAKENYSTTVATEEKYLSALYGALVQYKDQPSKAILKETIYKANGMDSIKKIDLVYGALKTYPDSVYKNLIQYF